MVQWLGLLALTADRAQVQYLVRELKSHEPCGVAKKEKKFKDKIDLDFSLDPATLPIEQRGKCYILSEPQFPEVYNGSSFGMTLCTSWSPGWSPMTLPPGVHIFVWSPPTLPRISLSGGEAREAEN